MRISCSRQAEAKSARGNHPGLSDPSCPSELSRIPCQCTALRTIVSLCRFIERILKECIASSCKKGPIFLSGDCIGPFQGPIFVSANCICPFQGPIFVSDDLIGPFQCDFIASSRGNFWFQKNCIALFDLFLQRLCIGVALIDTFSSIAAHHWLQGGTIYFVILK